MKLADPVPHHSRKGNTKYRKDQLAFVKRHVLNGGDLIDLGAGGQRLRKLYDTCKSYTPVDWWAYTPDTIVADITKHIPLSVESADIVILENTLEHLYKPLETLKEAYRLLRPNGKIIATVPFIKNVHQKPHDFHRYTDIALEAYFKEAGFEGIDITPFGNPRDTFIIARNLFFSYTIQKRTQIVMRLWRKLSHLLDGIFSRFDFTKPNRDFCAGYGIVAWKIIPSGFKNASVQRD